MSISTSRSSPTRSANTRTFAIPNPANDFPLLTGRPGTTTTTHVDELVNVELVSSSGGSTSTGGGSTRRRCDRWRLGTAGGGGSAARRRRLVGRQRRSRCVERVVVSGGADSAYPPYLVNPIRDHALGNNHAAHRGNPGRRARQLLAEPGSFPTPARPQQLVAPTQYQSGTGATFGIAFLSDLEVYLFLTAAQGDTRSNVLQAPKVTTFNGAAATIFSNVVQYYVAGLTPIVGPGAVAYTPQIGSVPNGVTMTVTPVVSADRRYVRMTLSPFFNANNGFTTFTVPSRRCRRR